MNEKFAQKVQKIDLKPNPLTVSNSHSPYSTLLQTAEDNSAIKYFVRYRTLALFHLMLDLVCAAVLAFFLYKG